MNNDLKEIYDKALSERRAIFERTIKLLIYISMYILGILTTYFIFK